MFTTLSCISLSLWSLYIFICLEQNATQGRFLKAKQFRVIFLLDRLPYLGYYLSIVMGITHLFHTMSESICHILQLLLLQGRLEREFDHPGLKMWTWLDSPPSAKVGPYLDRVLVRRADIDFVSCPTFHLIAWTDHKLVRVSQRFANRPSLAGYWKFNTSLLEIRDFRDQLESLIQWALVGAVTGNRWWVSLK